MVPALVNFTCGLQTSPSYESCFSSAEDELKDRFLCEPAEY